MADPMASGLSPASRRLLRLMHAIRFGEIRDLRVEDGEPQFDPAPVVIREVKLGAPGESHPRPAGVDFALKAQVVDLFRELTVLGTGTVDSLEIRDGLPFRLRLRGHAIPATKRPVAGGKR